MPTKSTDPCLNAPEPLQARSRFGHLVGKVYRQWRREVDLSFRELGLSDASRMPLLVLYVRDEPLRQKDLADALYLESSSLVRVLAQLRAAHMLDWASGPADKRTKYITLTPTGRETAALILAKSLEIEQAILADLSEQEQAVTRSALEKISRRFDGLRCQDKLPAGGALPPDRPTTTPSGA
jgi:MarR family transcriptional regulator for hemolysin